MGSNKKNNKRKSKNVIPKFSDINDAEMLKRYLVDSHRFNGRDTAYHYTNSHRLSDILESGALYLSKLEGMNDLLEFEKSDPELRNKLFIASLITEEKENIGMWSMYAQPWNDGVKISFPMKQFRNWIKNANEFIIVDNVTHKLTEEKIVAAKGSVCVGFIAYNNAATVSTTKIRTTWSTVINKRIEYSDSTGKLTGYVKDDAWKYEKELRILVWLDDAENIDHIALKMTDEVMSAMSVTTGPLFEGDIKAILSSQHKNLQIRDSLFKGKLAIQNALECNEKAIGCLLKGKK